MQLLTKPRKQKIKKAGSVAGNLTNAALAGAGTGSLIGLIKYPDSGKMQRRGAAIGAGVYAGASAVKSLMNRKKKKNVI